MMSCVTIQELAATSGIGEHVFKAAVRRGHLKVVRPGRQGSARVATLVDAATAEEFVKRWRAKEAARAEWRALVEVAS